MLKRILACLFILAVLPLLTSSVHNSNHPAPFQSIAFAGHVIGGGGVASCSPCGCGGGCICDPGEKPGPCTNGAITSDEDGIGHATAPTGKSGLDFGSSALMLAAALWLWARLRA